MGKQKPMIPKSGYRFSDKIMAKQKPMIPKSGYRFSDKIMGKQEDEGGIARRP
jgi:hypothetical protein